MSEVQNSLFASLHQVLMCADVTEKITLTRQLYADWQANKLVTTESSPVESIKIPGRPVKPELVAPRNLVQRKLGTAEGQAALIHAVTHIEFNAINLALDAAYRFRGLPADYYSDWLQVAVEEALHFSLLAERLGQLDVVYGDFPAHNGLWEMALKTDDNFLHRMAMVPRVFEARGLDVTPGMMKKFESIGDQETVAILEIILRDEVDHVRKGDRWYRWACDKENLEPEATFQSLIDSYLPGQVRGPFHESARLAAGFTQHELESLKSASACLDESA